MAHATQPGPAGRCLGVNGPGAADEQLVRRQETRCTTDGLGALTLHRTEGDEVFGLQSATLKAIRHAGEVELFFYVRGEGKVAGRQALTNAEVSVFLPDFDPAALGGRRFEVPRSWDHERKDHVSCVHYFEHQDLNRNVLEPRQLLK